MAKTAGFTLVELMIVVAVMGVLGAVAVPQFRIYRNRSQVTQVVAISEAIRAALASYAAGSRDNTYPPTTSITDFNSLRLVVNEHGGMLPESANFTVDHYDLYASSGNNVVDTYSMRLVVNGISSDTAGAQVLITPMGIFKCTSTGNPC